jgi:hypothetical protein
MAISYINNGTIKIGLELSWGGVISYFSEVAVERNVFTGDRFDNGVLSQAYWGDPLDENLDSAWNPNQGGTTSVYDFGNPVVQEYTSNGVDSGYLRVLPVQFDYMEGDSNPYMIMEQWITLIGNVAKIQCRATYSGPSRAGDYTEFPYENGSWYGQTGWNQETPAISFSNVFNNRVSYTGASPWTNGAVASLGVAPELYTEGSFVLATEKWAASLDNTGWGIGVYAAGSDAIAHVDIGGGSVYMTPSTCFDFENGLSTPVVFEFTVYLTLGTTTDIRTRFYDIHTGLTPFNVFNASSTSDIDTVSLVLTYGELSIESGYSNTTIEIVQIARAGGEFAIDGSTAASSVGTVEITQSYGILAISDCAATSAITTPTITLDSNGSGIRSPSGTSYTPRSITGEQLTIRRFSNGAWT